MFKLKNVISNQDISELQQFCAPGANRFQILCESLQRRKISFRVIPVGPSRHIALISAVNNPGYYRSTFVAHYDRVPGTPGANDNAAAVFQLLKHSEQHPESQILFTDREELTGRMSVTEQGSRKLAEQLGRLKINNLLFFVFDMCGIGDTLVWGIRNPAVSSPDTNRVLDSAEALLKRFSFENDFGINPLYSDDLGFVLGGFTALRISTLPLREARVLKERMDSDPAAQLSHGELPPSWQSSHTPEDRPEHLEPGAFILTGRLMNLLTRCRFPV